MLKGSMLLKLDQIRTSRERHEKVYRQEECPTGWGAFRVVAPVSLGFDVLNDKQQFQLIGIATTTLELSCSRCLEPFTLPVHVEFNLRYQPRAIDAGEGERAIEEGDLSTGFYENDEIDLSQLMFEQFYLSLPMKPLCRDDCKGLCSVCGMNLNRGTCGCRRDWEDPRLAVLRTLNKEP